MIAEWRVQGFILCELRTCIVLSFGPYISYDMIFFHIWTLGVPIPITNFAAGLEYFQQFKCSNGSS